MNVVAIGMSHHTSPVALREQFAFAENKIPDALKLLRENGIADEAVILSTCNRVELLVGEYAAPVRHAFRDPAVGVRVRPHEHASGAVRRPADPRRGPRRRECARARQTSDVAL